MVEQVITLAQTEPARVETDRLAALYSQLGEAGAEDVVCRAMEELAVRLAHIDRLYRQDDLSGVRKNARSLTGIAEQIGMMAVVHVSRDVLDCIDAGDRIALASVLARLMRLGERSLTEIWDLQEFSL